MHDVKSHPKNLRFRFFYILLRTLVFLAGCLPRRFCLFLGRGLGHLAFALMKSRAQVAMENLTLVYGETKTPAEKQKLASGNSPIWEPCFLNAFII